LKRERHGAKEDTVRVAIVDRARLVSRAARQEWETFLDFDYGSLSGCSTGREVGVCSHRGLGKQEVQSMGPSLALSDLERVLRPADLKPR
jgi:hypothetical protein